MKTLLIFVVLMALAVTAGSCYVATELDARSVVLKFDRSSSWSCALCVVHVFVNGVRVGEVNNGQQGRFRVPLSEDNSYEIMGRLIPVVGPNLDSPKEVVIAPQGSVIYARWESNLWVMRMFAEIRLEAAVERVGPKPSSVVPGRLERAGREFVGGFDEETSSLPWHIFSAVAAVVGALAAVAALFK